MLVPSDYHCKVPNHSFCLLLDVDGRRKEFLAECSECGAIATRTLDEVWQAGFVVCECGVQMAVLTDTLKALQAQATEIQKKLGRLLLAN
jgi:hypothetical protein